MKITKNSKGGINATGMNTNMFSGIYIMAVIAVLLLTVTGISVIPAAVAQNTTDGGNTTGKISSSDDNIKWDCTPGVPSCYPGTETGTEQQMTGQEEGILTYEEGCSPGVPGCYPGREGSYPGK